MADLIQKTDSLNAGRTKLNEAITQAEQAEFDASRALAQAESIRTELDTIVIEGDSSVEAAQARVDETGKVHPTLKARIDSGINRVSSKVDSDISAVTSLVNNGITTVTSLVGSEIESLGDRLDEMESRIKLDTSKTFVVTDNANVKGDGTNDDTSGIQAELDRAKTFSGVKVIIPAGKYKITEPLVLTRNTHLVLDQNAELVKNFNGGFLNNASATEVNTRYNGHGNIIVEGGIWDINAPTYSGGTPISFIHAENLVFRDMIIKDVNSGHAIEINGCKNVLISNVKALGYYGTTASSEAFQLDIPKAKATNPRYEGAWDNTPCVNIIIEKCYVGKSDRNGSYSRGVGGHNATIGVRNSNIIVRDNTFDNVSGFAVRMYSTREAIVSGNTFINCGSGILIDPPDIGDAEDTKDAEGRQTGGSQAVSGFIVSDNIIYGGGYFDAAIYLGGETSGNINNATITGNVIYGYGGTKNAIDVRNSNKVTISDNIISGTAVGSTGIFVSSSSKVTISGNSLENVLGHGIMCSGTGNHYNTISGNALFAIGEHGIYVASAIGISVIGNTIGGASYNTTLTSNAINLTNNCDLMTITGNIVRSSGNLIPLRAFSATSTCTKVVRSGNNFAGLSVVDSSIGGRSDGGDLI